MKNKQKTIEIRRARESKVLRNYFFNFYVEDEEKNYGIIYNQGNERYSITQ